MDSATDDWSPADNSYAVAVSQAHLWLSVVQLTIARIRSADSASAGWFSTDQLDAHVLVMTLRQLMTAEQLAQTALRQLNVDQEIGRRLGVARADFERALPGIKSMRDALMHFDEWSRGTGRGVQRERAEQGEALRDVARDYWRFGYDPTTACIDFGPWTISLETAEVAAHQLHAAIYEAARAVDSMKIADLRDRAVRALEDAGLLCGRQNDPQLSPGTDMMVWLSLPQPGEQDVDGRCRDAERVVIGLRKVGLELQTNDYSDQLGVVARLARGELLMLVEQTESARNKAVS